ncbi:MAG: hypothetical protein H6828_08785 [Planctomycetes bacterium]|nr:hypothetical protein [Planctomycetota bacterium]
MKTALLGTLAALALSLGTLAATAPASSSTTAPTQKGEVQKGEVQKGEGQKKGQESKKGEEAQPGAVKKGAGLPDLTLPLSTGDTEAVDVVATQFPSYPGEYCLAHGGRFDAAHPARNLVIDGQLYRVCSDVCASKVQLDTNNYYQRLRKAVIAAQKEAWPLDTCPVSGEAYDQDGKKSVDVVVGTRYVKLCCPACAARIQADPKKFLADLDKAVLPKLIATYPSETCVISGETLGGMGDPVDFMYGYRAVRLCCKGCVKQFNEDPRGFIETLYPRKAGNPGVKAPAQPEKGGKQ